PGGRVVPPVPDPLVLPGVAVVVHAAAAARDPGPGVPGARLRAQVAPDLVALVHVDVPVLVLGPDPQAREVQVLGARGPRPLRAWVLVEALVVPVVAGRKVGV